MREGQKNCTPLAQGPSGARHACQRSAIFLPLEHLPSNYIISILFHNPTIEQIPLRGPDDGTILLHPLGTSAAISIAPLQHVCQGGAMKIAPSSGPRNGYCFIVGLYYKVIIIWIAKFCSLWCMNKPIIWIPYTEQSILR